MIRLALPVVLLTFASLTNSQISSGGQFVLTQSVIATGGNSMQGGQTQISGTAAQSVAGQKTSSQPFATIAGFWTPDDLQPTAAHVSLTGQIRTADGRGISGIRVMMSGPDSESRFALSNSFGYFRFDDVEVGRTYIFAVTSRRYQFENAVAVRNVLDSVDDLIFIAVPN